MSMGRRDEDPALAVFQTVRCLDCGAVYAKPARGSTEKVNPGCPDCGYVGWLAVDVPIRTPARRRFAEDLRRDRSA
jgi:predicted  nucleic acid-binding Zn-ribbon protein